MSMLNHQKAIIEHVIDSDKLFVKELNKSVRWLNANETRKLYIWLKEKYGSSHADMINLVFNKKQSIDIQQ